MRNLLLSAAMMIAPAMAQAETFDVLAWNPDHLVAIDRESVESVGDQKRVWITVIYAAPRADMAQPYRGIVGHQEFDCAAGRFHTLESRPFDENGVSIPDLAIDQPTSWTPVTPGALSADERERLCDGQWSSASYHTKLATLLSAYALRPDTPPSLAAASPTAAQFRADAAATTAAPR